MEWLLPILLLTALLLSVGLSVWQTKRYTADVNRLALAHQGPGRQLVSGRGKGRLRGAVVVLVVDAGTREVLDASVMTGATVAARLRPAPALVGPLDSINERTTDTMVQRAVADALTRLKGGRPPSTSLSTAAPGSARSNGARQHPAPTRIPRPRRAPR